ncbi:glycosyltransferase [Methanothermobacter sp. CaT2]|uniref:glycosyltransferase n=1 Tax=Methanothermobacter sp. CaT2 TaxID=866790 RepID=UPI0002CCF51C|nr:glycosyltransferase [Methanothermobacter sp. CaT2]BAM69537.1 glycosyltransferase [Methanothermobacter sp. CaT2]
MEGKIFAVTVTYGNRFHLLKKVIEAALREGVHKVIVVDNNSDKQSREKLMEYHAKNRTNVEVLYLPENLGSAGGFKRGLELAYSDPECEFIWLLDDDNMPCPGSLRILTEYWDKMETNYGKPLALLSYRKKEIYTKSLLLGDPKIIMGRENSFFNFHICEIPNYIKNRLTKKRNRKYKTDQKFVELSVAPYGGLFFKKEIVKIIGYPNEKFYLYSDDYDWTYRITKMGGHIILLKCSYIKDLDKWQEKTLLSSFTPLNAHRMYYLMRNQVYFENKYLKKNEFIYTINYLVFITLILLKSIFSFKTLYVFRIALKASADGRKGKLGIRSSIDL